MSDYKPLYFGLGLIIVMALFMNFVVLPFVDTDEIEVNNFLLNSSYNYIDNGVSITVLDPPFFDPINVEFNLFRAISDGLADYLLTQLALISLIPSIYLNIIMLFFLLGIVYTIVKMLPTT